MGDRWNKLVSIWKQSEKCASHSRAIDIAIAEIMHFTNCPENAIHFSRWYNFAVSPFRSMEYVYKSNYTAKISIFRNWIAWTMFEINIISWIIRRVFSSLHFVDDSKQNGKCNSTHSRQWQGALGQKLQSQNESMACLMWWKYFFLNQKSTVHITVVPFIVSRLLNCWFASI